MEVTLHVCINLRNGPNLANILKEGLRTLVTVLCCAALHLVAQTTYQHCILT